MGSGIADETTFYDPTMSVDYRLIKYPRVVTFTTTSSEPDDPLDQLAAYGWMRAYRRWESQPITITLPPNLDSDLVRGRQS